MSASSQASQALIEAMAAEAVKLRDRVTELEAREVVARAEHRRALAEAQAREAALMTALGWSMLRVLRPGPHDGDGYIDAYWEAHGLLAAKPDDAALREFGRKCVVQARENPTQPDAQAVDAVLRGGS